MKLSGDSRQSGPEQAKGRPKSRPKSKNWVHSMSNEPAGLHTEVKQNRAGDRTRTGDVQLGKLAFYQLNYARNSETTYRRRGPVKRSPRCVSTRRLGACLHPLGQCSERAHY